MTNFGVPFDSALLRPVVLTTDTLNLAPCAGLGAGAGGTPRSMFVLLWFKIVVRMDQWTNKCGIQSSNLEATWFFEQQLMQSVLQLLARGPGSLET